MDDSRRVIKHRKACMERRAMGLIKKTSELSTLCGVEAYIIISDLKVDGCSIEPKFWPPNPEGLKSAINKKNEYMKHAMKQKALKVSKKAMKQKTLKVSKEAMKQKILEGSEKAMEKKTSEGNEKESLKDGEKAVEKKPSEGNEKESLKDGEKAVEKNHSEGSESL